MIQEILNAVTKQLFDTFGFVNNFTDEVEQGIEKPYTFTTVEASPLAKQAGDRYSQTATVSVISEIEETPTMYDTLRTMGEQLTDALEYLTLSDGSKIRGDNAHLVTQNGFLDFTIDYDYFIRKIKTPEQKMNTVSENITVKNN